MRRCRVGRMMSALPLRHANPLTHQHTGVFYPGGRGCGHRGTNGGKCCPACNGSVPSGVALVGTWHYRAPGDDDSTKGNFALGSLSTMSASLSLARDLLHSVFGFSAFRPGQEEIVQAVLDGESVLAVMP